MGARFSGKVAIVTGASSGIGRATALALGRDGATVMVNHRDASTLADAQAVCREIEAAGGRGQPVRCDVGVMPEVRAMFDETFRQFGRLDILVNNAALAKLAPIADTTEALFDAMFAINVKGVFFACQEAARRMSEGGRIINISSATTGLALPGYGAYDGTKGALEQISRILARELGPKKITVNIVSPGATETEQFRAGKSDETIKRLEAMSVFGRLGTPPEIAAVIAFLASDEAGWVTGQNIRVNGGTV
jgi:3-oxoacyl-[acyl-carrier protein] reductase